MTINAGVWIDYRKAVVVIITDEGETMFQIMSDPDIPARYQGGARWKNSYTSTDDPVEDNSEDSLRIYLNKFYDEVIERLRDADSILILGPVEAKVELKERFQSKNYSGRVTRVDTVDKMTDPEISALVRQLFCARPQ